MISKKLAKYVIDVVGVDGFLDIYNFIGEKRLRDIYKRYKNDRNMLELQVYYLSCDAFEDRCLIEYERSSKNG